MNYYSTIYLFASFIGKGINRLEKLLLMSDTQLQSSLAFSSTKEIPYSGNFFGYDDRKNIRKYRSLVRGNR